MMLLALLIVISAGVMPHAASAASWPLKKIGSSGADVVAMQYLLQAHGYSLKADGAFGPITDGKVRSFQRSRGLSIDGIVGPQTWPRLIVTVRRGSHGAAVRAVQHELRYKYGVGIAVDGDFGPMTYSAVVQFQRSHSLAGDGIVGLRTWSALIVSPGGDDTTPGHCGASVSPNDAVHVAICRAAQRWGGSYSLLLRLATCESDLDPHAYNTAGASGLFQFMSSTYAEWAPRVPESRSLWNPYASANVAAYMIAHGQFHRWECANKI